MSHFPAGQVVSSVPAWPATAIRQGPAMDSQRVTLATYSASVNLKTTGVKVVFTTEANRGQFVPLSIAAYCELGTGAGATSAAISVGWNPANTQPYIDWVNQESVPPVTTGGHGSGNYVLQSDTWAFDFGQYFISAPPSTAVVVYVFNAATATIDTRTFVISGFYTL